MPLQTVTDAIEKLPNPDDVCPDDTETEKMAKEAEHSVLNHILGIVGIAQDGVCFSQ